MERVADECVNFDPNTALTVCVEENPERSYDEPEAACMAMAAIFLSPSKICGYWCLKERWLSSSYKNYPN